MDALGFAVQGELEEEYLLISHFFFAFHELSLWSCAIWRAFYQSTKKGGLVSCKDHFSSELVGLSLQLSHPPCSSALTLS